MFQIDPPTEAIIVAAQGEIVPGRTASRSEVLRHFADHWKRTGGGSAPVRVTTTGGPHALTTTVTGPRSFAVNGAEETPTQRLERLREAAGLTQPALAAELGLTRSKYQRAIAAGKLPAGAEAWMRAREGGRGVSERLLTKEDVFLAIDDLVSDFLYYDRKESESLPLGAIDDMVNHGQITIAEMVERFRKGLENDIGEGAP